ncbi:UNVERIFIED_CONTAM: hypothetical protein Sangu_1707100 [Sesamum angustifolium]|uniref:Uncharacterized protein n=1 Tax=Sesamum angustifolium TaxID=2727405 RepID=A0AAW2MNB6_9LAMI
MEENMLHQRSKLQWLKHGDQNSKVFFRKINAMRARQRIFQISTPAGEVLTDMKDVTDEFVSYFQTLLGGTRVQRDIDLNFLQSGLKYCFTIEEADTICAPITLTEIKDAAFDIDEDSAPGPDGYTSGFFKASWSVVGNDISAAVGEFFTTGRLLKQADLPSIQVIKDSLQEFAALSGLQVNPNKSQIILSRVGQQGKQQILDLLGFQEGFLPVKYLGVPLISSRLTMADCKPLIDKLDSRIAGWNHLNLTYAGRAQLIKSVLSSLHSYWASVFILPKGVIKILEAKMRKFLWQGSTGRGYAKVEWEQVCRPKEEGGLGFRNPSYEPSSYAQTPMEAYPK